MSLERSLERGLRLGNLKYRRTIISRSGMLPRVRVPLNPSKACTRTQKISIGQNSRLGSFGKNKKSGGYRLQPEEIRRTTKVSLLLNRWPVPAERSAQR